VGAAGVMLAVPVSTTCARAEVAGHLLYSILLDANA